jgi:hypothetical protein
MTTPAIIGEIVNRKAKEYDLRADIVLGIILQESRGNTFAWRHEEDWFFRNMNGKKREQLSGWAPAVGELPSLYDECMQRSCSFGLMQCLGDTARWCAKVTAPYLTALCDPEIGIDAGCRILSFYLKREKTYEKALAAYNAGTSRSLEGQRYAQKVLKRLTDGEHKKFLEGR